MIPGAFLLALVLAGPEPFLPRDFLPPAVREREAVLRCTRFWLDHVSPEAAGGACACYVRGLRHLSGKEEVPAARLKPWPRRTKEAGRAFRSCLDYFLATDLARCDRWGVRQGLGKGSCCGSSGCLPDFALEVALDSGYIVQETELEGAEHLPRHAWSDEAGQRFKASCGLRGLGPKRCACYLEVARIEFSEQEYDPKAEESIYDPPNAWDELIRGCDRVHKAEPVRKPGKPQDDPKAGKPATAR